MKSIALLACLLIAVCSAHYGGHRHHGRSHYNTGYHGHGMQPPMIGRMIQHILGGGLDLQTPDAEVKERVKALLTAESTTEIVAFLQSMTSSYRGQKLLRLMGSSEEMVEQLIAKLNGSTEENLEAKQNLAEVASKIDGMSWIQVLVLREMLAIYDQSQSAMEVREIARDKVLNSSTEDLLKVLDTLSMLEKRCWLGQIKFSDLYELLDTQGEAARDEVNEALINWIDGASEKELKKVGMILRDLFNNVGQTTTTTTLPPLIP